MFVGWDEMNGPTNSCSWKRRRAKWWRPDRSEADPKVDSFLSVTSFVESDHDSVEHERSWVQ